jgi:hypothetical protein
MAIVVVSTVPSALLAGIKKDIDGGKIDTWEYDADGDFTHSPDQWRYKAWLRPTLQEDRVIFRIMPPVKTHMSRAVYAVYHGRFVEMLLAHFDTKFSVARVTAMPSHGDSVGQS